MLTGIWGASCSPRHVPLPPSPANPVSLQPPRRGERLPVPAGPRRSEASPRLSLADSQAPCAHKLTTTQLCSDRIDIYEGSECSQTVGGTHLPCNKNLCIKCILPATVSSPRWPLRQDIGQCSLAAPRDTWARTGGARSHLGASGHWTHPLPTLPAPAGLRGLASLCLEEDSHHRTGRKRDSS